MPDSPAFGPAETEKSTAWPPRSDAGPVTVAVTVWALSLPSSLIAVGGVRANPKTEKLSHRVTDPVAVASLAGPTPVAVAQTSCRPGARSSPGAVHVIEAGPAVGRAVLGVEATGLPSSVTLSVLRVVPVTLVMTSGRSAGSGTAKQVVPLAVAMSLSVPAEPPPHELPLPTANG